ncbi:MAG: rod shape-determining protein RodA [Planctomycetes bacterium]|nr:rod shape-determining protein RodA [Planctomycetota bacterium]
MRLKRIIADKNADYSRFPVILTITVLILVIFSIINISSASIRSIGDNEYVDDGYHIKQTIWLALSLIVFIAVIRIDYKYIVKYTLHAYLFSIFLLLLVFFVGTSVNGSQRWLNIGFMLFQPSELAKLTVILFVAYLLKHSQDTTNLKGVLKPIAYASIPLLMILKQPDLGSSLVIVPVVATMLLVANLKKRILLSFALICVIIAPIAYFTMLKDYQRDRIIAFMNPEDYAKTDGYHLIQSRTAVGDGKLFGVGYKNGTQSMLGYLPENHTDFIFSVVSEEWGFVGASAVIVLYFFLIAQILIIAAETQERFGKYVCVGIAILFAFQVYENIGMTIGLMPITGLTLPFFSYGGSSLIICFLSLGIIVSIRIHPKTT